MNPGMRFLLLAVIVLFGAWNFAAGDDHRFDRLRVALSADPIGLEPATVAETKRQQTSFSGKITIDKTLMAYVT